MHIFQTLLVLPALTVLAKPIFERSGPSLHTSRQQNEEHSGIWRRAAPVSHSYHLNDRDSEILSTTRKQYWKRAINFDQPDLPEFIDTGACLCGLLTKESTTPPTNGEIIEMWRCTAALNHDISVGTHGKWYNTTLPSQDLSGVNKGRTWDENPPYVGQTFVLTYQGDVLAYELLDPTDSGALRGNDTRCDGVKDPVASAAFYATQTS